MPEWLDRLLWYVVTGMVGVIAYFLKSNKTQQDKQVDALQEQVDQLQRELQQFKLESADKFVLKDDFVRATALTDRKLDRIYDEIIKLSRTTEAAK